MNNIEELKKVALAATPGPWEKCDSYGPNENGTCISAVESPDLMIASTTGYYGRVGGIANTHFIALANPAVILDLIAQLEAAQLELIKPLPIGELLHRLEGQTYRKWYDDDELNKWRERAEKAEAELSAANEKHGWIKCSDQMPDPNRQRRVCVFTPHHAADLRYRLVPANLFKAVCSSATHWHYVNDPVEGEPAPVKYIVILQRAWCNDSGSGIDYHSDLVEFDNRDKAIKHGFKLQDSDDFNIGVLTNGILTSFDWMAKPLAENKDSLARIASGIGIEGNADAE
ncbi:hypothetical protein ACQPRD_004155 [Yersinia enterocolitica]|uniref:hypothetical protein n=1 Tax=Yersinia enterocolitica TaxID=630 RepID=UPI003DB2DD05